MSGTHIASPTLLLLSGYLLGRRADRAREPAEIVRTDTLRIRDTVLVDRPVPVEVRLTDTMLVAVTDTVTVNDTVYLSLPSETRVYGDSTYRAQVSGYRPALDWIEVSAQTRRIMDEMKARGMNISREVDDMFMTFARNFGLIKDDERGARP